MESQNCKNDNICKFFSFSEVMYTILESVKYLQGFHSFWYMGCPISYLLNHILLKHKQFRSAFAKPKSSNRKKKMDAEDFCFNYSKAAGNLLLEILNNMIDLKMVYIDFFSIKLAGKYKINN